MVLAGRNKNYSIYNWPNLISSSTALPSSGNLLWDKSSHNNIIVNVPLRIVPVSLLDLIATDAGTTLIDDSGTSGSGWSLCVWLKCPESVQVSLCQERGKCPSSPS